MRSPGAKPGPADTDRPAAHQQSTILRVRMRDLLDADGTFLARPYRHCAHVRIVTPGSRGCLTRQRVTTVAVGTPDDRVMTSLAPEPFDVVVVGAGPAGFVAALRVAPLGARELAAIDLDHPGMWVVDHLETAVEAGVA
jgi:hypothetical protein